MHNFLTKSIIRFIVISLIILNLVPAKEATLKISMKLDKRFPFARNGSIIFSIVSSNMSDELLIVDNNSSLKQINLSSGTNESLYRSIGNICGAAFVEDGQNRIKTLLFAEMRSNARNKSLAYFLIVAENTRNMWFAASRFTIDSVPSTPDNSSFVTICTVHKNKVLCAVCESFTLDVFTLVSARELHKEAPLRLGFRHLCFTCGESNGTTLLFVREWEGDVRILEVSDGEALTLQLVRRITGGVRLLWCNNDILLCTDWNQQSETDAVQVWRVSHGGQRVEQLDGSPITHSDNLRIECWCLLGDKIALYDLKSGAIILYSVELS